MTLQELKNRFYPSKERCTNSFGIFDVVRYDSEVERYNAVCAGDEKVINYWMAFFVKEEKKAEVKKANEKQFNKGVQDNLTSIARELNITKTALVAALKKDQKLYNNVRFKNYRDMEVIKSML